LLIATVIFAAMFFSGLAIAFIYDYIEIRPRGPMILIFGVAMITAAAPYIVGPIIYIIALVAGIRSGLQERREQAQKENGGRHDD
jgi:hypothetical protein